MFYGGKKTYIPLSVYIPLFHYSENITVMSVSPWRCRYKDVIKKLHAIPFLAVFA